MLTEKTLTLYVYYKLPTHYQTAYLMAIKHFYQDTLLIYPSLTIQYQKKWDQQLENQETYMEIYAKFSNQQLEKLKIDLSLLAARHNLPSERKYEVFIIL